GGSGLGFPLFPRTGTSSSLYPYMERTDFRQELGAESGQRSAASPHAQAICIIYAALDLASFSPGACLQPQRFLAMTSWRVIKAGGFCLRSSVFSIKGMGRPGTQSI
ncbi:uncharacterized, partial [Tachysurus ichikawai]